jgi:hypothetical protein
VLNGKPIEKTSVEMRLSPLGWPAGADSDDMLFRAYNDAAGDAQQVYQGFQQVVAANANNPALTDIGQRQARFDWAEKNLPALHKQLETVRQRAADATAGAMKMMTASFTEPATEPQDIAMMQEVRNWLRGLPENQRAATVVEMARKGDRTILRAVLNAPSYLTGVTEDQLMNVREIVAKADHPERFAKLELVQRAAEYAELACDRELRYVEQEAMLLGKTPGARPVAA